MLKVTAEQFGYGGPYFREQLSDRSEGYSLSQPVVVKTQTIQAWTVQPTDDGRQVAIVLKTQSGTSGYALSPQDFSRFAVKAVSEAGRLAKHVPGPPLAPANATLVPVGEISLSAHPTEASTAVVSVQVGDMPLSFTVDTESLLRSVKQFLDHRRASRTS
jgi:hypothetical protein